MKYLLITINTFFSFIASSQCNFSIEELVNLQGMTNTQIETLTLERGMSLLMENTYVCDENSDILQVEKDAESSTFSIITSDKTLYLNLKKEIEANTTLNREEKYEQNSYYTYLYEKCEYGLCEVMFNSSIDDSGNWKGTVIVMIIGIGF